MTASHLHRPRPQDDITRQLREAAKRAKSKKFSAETVRQTAPTSTVNPSVAVLFARADSIYKTLPGCDVYDIERDARTWSGGCPVVAHPPCRTWGTLSHLFTHPEGERGLAPWAVQRVRMYGGVLEHPSKSRLWPELGLPPMGTRDAFGGWTMAIHQSDFGHRAQKKTRLYIVGCEPWEVPEFPISLGKTTHVISQNRTLPGGRRLRKGMPGWRPDVSEAEQEHTPPELALWLVELARRCSPPDESFAAMGDAAWLEMQERGYGG